MSLSLAGSLLASCFAVWEVAHTDHKEIDLTAYVDGEQGIRRVRELAGRAGLPVRRFWPALWHEVLVGRDPSPQRVKEVADALAEPANLTGLHLGPVPQVVAECRALLQHRIGEIACTHQAPLPQHVADRVALHLAPAIHPEKLRATANRLMPPDRRRQTATARGKEGAMG